MNPIHSLMHESITLETEDKDRAFGIPDLEKAVSVSKRSDAHLNVDLSSAGPMQVARSLERHGNRVTRYWMHSRYRSDSTSGEFDLYPEPLFWDRAPEDCAGAFLASDGYV